MPFGAESKGILMGVVVGTIFLVKSYQSGNFWAVFGIWLYLFGMLGSYPVDSRMVPIPQPLFPGIMVFQRMVESRGNVRAEPKRHTFAEVSRVLTEEMSITRKKKQNGLFYTKAEERINTL